MTGEREKPRSDPSRPQIVVVGLFPPPRNGVSAVNESLFAELQEQETTVERCSTASVSVHRTIWVRMRRLPAILRAIWRIVSVSPSRGGIVFYFSLSGGGGLAYEAIFVLLARVRGARIFMHHNSFSYIDRASVLMRLLARVGGARAVHIAVCLKMAEVLRSRYNVKEVRSISNAAFLELRDTMPSRNRPFSLQAVGFLANLSFEKGVDDVIALARRMTAMNFHVAGPFQDRAVERFFEAACTELPNVKYWGSVYGDAKRTFFSEIDAFVFPTKYRNEAEPLVILEALLHGCPVIANDRGCIGGLLSEGGGVAVKCAEGFVTEASATLLRWSESPMAYEQSSREATKRFREIFDEATRSRKTLIDEIFSLDVLTQGNTQRPSP